MNPIGRDQLMFDYCWVCEARFRTSTPPGPAHREDHHIFPRNAGGEDGPLVSLCDTHHTSLHKIAKRLQSQKGYNDLLIGEAGVRIKKLLWLAAMVVKAEKSVEGDPNKQLLQTIKLSKTESKMLERLQTVYPKQGRSAIMGKALSLLYLRHFPRK